jgi:hypothetical protein
VYQDQFFNLTLHDDSELAALLGSPIAQRTTLHHWPLSHVQHVITADGTQWIYKSQTGPTVEAAFYAQAQSDLLVAARTLDHQADQLIMLFPYIDAPLAENLEPDLAQVLHWADTVLEQIAAIQGDVPVLLDVSRVAKWRARVGQLITTLRALVAAGTFTQVTAKVIQTLEAAALSAETLAAVEDQTGLVHGDLTGDNLFVLPDGGYRLIDWTRPLRGPTALDKATLLESLGVDPRPHVRPGILTLLTVLRVDWLAQCADRWFPAGRDTYDASIAQLIADLNQAE